ncbi:MAG: carboxypeptidase regulatory-like domain-containing protein [Vicinamibacterales bacterium]
MRVRITGWVIALLLTMVGGAAAQERFGGIAGSVTDPQQGALPGATVTATNNQTGAVRTTVTGTDGRFQLADLEPGRYSVIVELQGFQRLENRDVLVLLGRTVEFPAQLQLGQISETVQVTGEAARQIDPRSTAITHNITAEEIDRIPKARSFQNLALTAPSVNTGQLEGGLQINGASGAENAFTVDGVVTNSLVNGRSRQDTVFEYVQEVQVKTAGIDAEYGGALGGVVSAVTKSGGNAFHGEGHYYFDGSPISAGPVKRLVLDPSNDTTVAYVQDPKQKQLRNEFGGSLGGPVVKDHLFFFGSLSPRLIRAEREYLFSNGTQPGSIPQDTTYTQTFGKLTAATGRLTANVSELYTPNRTTGTLTAYNGFGPLWTSTSLAGNQPNIGRGFTSDQSTTSVNVDYWVTNRSFFSARGGYFYDKYADTGIPNTTSVTWNQPSTAAACVPCASLPASLQQGLGFSNVPRAQIANYDTTKRAYVDLNYTQQLQAAGSHLIKAGFGYQHVTNDVNSSYPGGYVLLNWDSTFVRTGAGGRGTYGYYEVNDFGTVGKAGADIRSLFVQDQWTMNRLTLNLGIRTENEKIPTFRPDIAEYAINFGFADKLAPRLGATYDLAGDGRTKLFGSWGRYFDWTKYELSRGSFGGDYWHVFYRSLDTTDVFNLSINNMPGQNLWSATNPAAFRDRRVPSIDAVDPDLRPMSQDQTNFGVEHQLTPTTVIGAHFVHNNLRETIEDLGALVNGDEVYVIGNPGRGITATTPTSGLTPAFDTPKVKRTYDALELTVNRRFSQNYFVGGSYTYSRLYGNYAGLASSDEIRTPTTGTTSAAAQQQVGEIFREGGNANRAWDIDEILFDARGTLDVLGRLATDRPHVVKVYGAWQAPFGTQFGAFFYGGSGTPISTYVVTTNQIPVFVNGRGDMGRTPFLTRTDLLVAHQIPMGGNRALRLELNLLNAFNQKTATHIFNYLNKGAGLPRGDAAIDLSHVNLFNGYDYRALINATPSGAASYDPRYGMEDLWQAGTQGQFSVRFLF